MGWWRRRKIRRAIDGAAIAASFPCEIHVFANQWKQHSELIRFHKIPIISFPKYLTTVSFAWFAQRRIEKMGFLTWYTPTNGCMQPISFPAQYFLIVYGCGMSAKSVFSAYLTGQPSEWKERWFSITEDTVFTRIGAIAHDGLLPNTLMLRSH